MIAHAPRMPMSLTTAPKESSRPAATRTSYERVPSGTWTNADIVPPRGTLFPFRFPTCSSIRACRDTEILPRVGGNVTVGIEHVDLPAIGVCAPRYGCRHFQGNVLLCRSSKYDLSHARIRCGCHHDQLRR